MESLSAEGGLSVNEMNGLSAQRSFSPQDGLFGENAEHPMAKAEYADMIKTVSGALTKINKKDPHAADQKMVLATHRVAETTSKGCSRIYLRGLSAVTRKTAVGEDELAARQRFAAVGTAVAARAKDLSKITTDQQNFIAQKDSPNGKKTMKSYLWSLELAAYDQAHS